VADLSYVDTSALVKLVVAEPESWALGEAIRERTLLSSDLARVELVRTIRQLGLGSGALERASRVLARVAFHRVQRRILERAAVLEPPRLRSLDAIHLATALTIPELSTFITYDRRLGSAAEQVGLSVLAPA
jgi:hypothetical protein